MVTLSIMITDLGFPDYFCVLTFLDFNDVNCFGKYK
jgi:hypothetical protein